ncbi:hypothetical protein GCM10025871_15490 [Deinococcus metallilatus]|nr:hypothetical protein GCM10025871_15490 [Deinococcus metallilatus]
MGDFTAPLPHLLRPRMTSASSSLILLGKEASMRVIARMTHKGQEPIPLVPRREANPLGALIGLLPLVTP